MRREGFLWGGPCEGSGGAGGPTGGSVAVGVAVPPPQAVSPRWCCSTPFGPCRCPARCASPATVGPPLRPSPPPTPTLVSLPPVGRGGGGAPTAPPRPHPVSFPDPLQDGGGAGTPNVSTAAELLRQGAGGGRGALGRGGVVVRFGRCRSGARCPRSLHGAVPRLGAHGSADGAARGGAGSRRRARSAAPPAVHRSLPRVRARHHPDRPPAQVGAPPRPPPVPIPVPPRTRSHLHPYHHSAPPPPPRLFFRRHYPVANVTFCSTDPEDRR